MRFSSSAWWMWPKEFAPGRPESLFRKKETCTKHIVGWLAKVTIFKFCKNREFYHAIVFDVFIWKRSKNKISIFMLKFYLERPSRQLAQLSFEYATWCKREEYQLTSHPSSARWNNAPSPQPYYHTTTTLPPHTGRDKLNAGSNNNNNNNNNNNKHQSYPCIIR